MTGGGQPDPPAPPPPAPASEAAKEQILRERSDRTREASRHSLDRALVGGLAWSAAGRWLSQLFRWAATIVTARLLLPSDYGVVGIATVVVGLLQVVAEFGFGAAIVQQRTLSNDQVRQIGGASVVIGLGLGLLVVLLTHFAVLFFRQPALIYVLPVLSLRFLVDAFAVVPRSVLARDLEFRKLSVLEGVESLVMAAVTVGLAWLTRSYWALILGVIAGGLVFTVLAYREVPLAPRLPESIESVRAQLRFGVNVVLARLSWYTYTNADFIVVGRLMSETVLGLYTMAWYIASVPAEKLAGLVLRVAPSVLSASREQPGEMRRYYLLMVRGVALVTFPLAAGLSLVASPFVLGVLGSKWMGVIDVLRLLALFFAVRSIASLGPVVMITQGKPQVDRNYSMLFLVLLPPAFVLGAQWGIVGVAATWLIAYPLLFGLFGQRWVLRSLGIRVGEFLREVWPALSSAVLMSLPVVAVDLALPRLPALVKLSLMTGIGAATYLLALRVLHRQAFDAAWQLIRNRGATAP